MSFFAFILIGLCVGLIMGFLVNEKRYVLLAFIVTAVVGALLAGGLFRVFISTSSSCYVASAIGAILAIFAGIALLVYIVRKKDAPK